MVFRNFNWLWNDDLLNNKKKCYKGIYFEVYDKEKAVYETS